MLDIKAYSPEVHKMITGYSNDKILKSIQYLNTKNKLKEVRFVLVPDYNDDEIEIRKMIDFLKSVSTKVEKVLIKMRKHGIRKEYSHLSEPSDIQMENTRMQFEKSGIQVQVI